jgi:transposase InsO family protein
MGNRDHPTAPRSPWQNGHVERLIGSIRSECLDPIVVVGEVSLHRTLKAYARYFNEVRTHRSLEKDAPETRPAQFIGLVLSRPVLGGLHQYYVRL